MSPGIVAGISVASAAGALIIAALFWFLLRCARKRCASPAERSAVDGAAREETSFPPRRDVDAKASHEHAGNLPVAELGDYGNRMSWENTREHMMISPASAYTQDGRGTPVRKVDSYSAVSTGDRFSL